jgi:hypothetical protein
MRTCFSNGGLTFHIHFSAGRLELSCRKPLCDRTFHCQRKQKDRGEGATRLVSIINDRRVDHISLPMCCRN